MTPRITYGIPTMGSRPELLERAIGSALGQTLPAQVLVSFQGDEIARREAAAKWQDHPLVRFAESPATNLWQNWCHVAAECETPYFAWLQDDDILAQHAARRAVAALDNHPSAVCHIARLGVSYGEGLANWWEATGPMLPMDLLRGTCSTMTPALMAAGAYLTSHALSPAVAFRRTPSTVAAIRSVPDDSDLFAERSVLVALSRFGAAVCDPAIVGYWIQHVGNESRAQNTRAGEGERQYRRMCKYVDPIVSASPGWKDAVRGHAYLVGQRVAEGWHGHASPFRDDSEPCGEAVAILEDLYPSLRRLREPESAVDTRIARAERAVART